jgi:protein-S-isoprenylcysteine O-methyltransferase Ste14
MHALASRFVALCWLAFGVIWLAAALSTRRPTVRRGSANPWWLLPLVPVVVVVTVLLLFVRRRHPGLLFAPWSSSPAVGIVADVVAFGGLVIALWARRTLGRLWSASPTIKEDHSVIETGPYRFVRHPIYSGVLLMIAGTVVLFDNPIAAVWFAFAFAGIWIKLRREEQLLRDFLPEAYEGYRARVRWILIPGVL